MNIKPGIRLLEETEGSGIIAERGDTVVYNLRAFLSKGDEVALNVLSEEDRSKIEQYYPSMLNRQDGYEYLNFSSTLGTRQAACTGVEYTLYGMREEGYRKVRVSPHLAYRDKGLPDKVPPNAVVIFEIWLRKIIYKAEHSGSGLPVRQDR
jgi:FKBP-type peptidyl-prolyl cis-trans isomerase